MMRSIKKKDERVVEGAMVGKEIVEHTPLMRYLGLRPSSQVIIMHHRLVRCRKTTPLLLRSR